MTSSNIPPPGTRFITEDEDQRWPVAIGDLIKAKIELEKVDPLYPLTIPEVKASQTEVAEAEERLGFGLDPQHSTLLRHVNGWEDIALGANMLKTEEIGQGALWIEAMERLDIYYRDSPVGPGFPRREDIYPIAASPYQVDIFVIARRSETSHGGHKVLWLASEVIQEWPNIYQWLLSMKAYVDESIADAKPQP